MRSARWSSTRRHSERRRPTGWSFPTDAWATRKFAWAIPWSCWPTSFPSSAARRRNRSAAHRSASTSTSKTWTRSSSGRWPRAPGCSSPSPISSTATAPGSSRILTGISGGWRRTRKTSSPRRCRSASKRCSPSERDGEDMMAPAVVMDPSTPFKRLGPVSRLREFVTPVEDVHVLAHLGVAHVDPRQWRLRIDGMVERPFVLDLEELLELPARELTAVFECYGNPLRPDIAARSVANVVWRGVPLAGLLARAGPRPQATLAHLEGMDSGTFADVYCERYIKDIPIERALNEDVLVAYAMNGAPLTPEHGFPARAVVPGYFGTNSDKWLSRVIVASARPEGLFTTRLYNRGVHLGGREQVEPAWEIDVNAVIVWPAEQDRVRPGPHLVSGWAWSASPIAHVEVSTDGGASWLEAEVAPPASTRTWQRFGFVWDAPEAGAYEIRVRATDVRGRVQPATGRNSLHRVTVSVA